MSVREWTVCHQFKMNVQVKVRLYSIGNLVYILYSCGSRLCAMLLNESAASFLDVKPFCFSAYSFLRVPCPFYFIKSCRGKCNGMALGYSIRTPGNFGLCEIATVLTVQCLPARARSRTSSLSARGHPSVCTRRVIYTRFRSALSRKCLSKLSMECARLNTRSYID